MNQIIQKIIFIPLLFLLCAPACRKVDQELEKLGAGLSATYFPQGVMVDDSLSVSGRLHMENSPVITLGGVVADYVFEGTKTNKDPISNAVVTIETLRFKVTAEMGEGRRPLEIRSGNQTQVLYVDIRSRPALGDSRPDTTLVVEEIYRDQGINTYEFTGRSVSADGTIYLQSPGGIYSFRNGQFQTLLTTGDQLTIDGRQVNIKEYITSYRFTSGDAFSGVAVSADNSTLYLSVYTDMASGEDYTGAWLLLKTDPALSSFEILNRSEHRHSVDSTFLELPGFPGGGLWLVEDQNTYLPAEVLDNGPLENTRLMAENLAVDAQSRLLFSNGDYYARLETNKRITAFSDETTVFTQDGMQALILSRGGSGHGVTLFDLERMEPAATVPPGYNWSLASFETNPDWRYITPSRIFSLGAGVLPRYSLMGLPNGELLDLGFPSIGAINPATGSIYTFAGIEKGYDSRTDALVPEQNQLTGPARYVNFQFFTMADGVRVGEASFIGMDNRNNIYFLRGGLGTGANFTSLCIYRLGKPD